MTTKTDLNNLPLSTSGITAYRGVSLTCVNKHHTYVAFINLNDDEQSISGRKSPVHHLSYHSDPRVAAFVVAEFNKNRHDNLIKLNQSITGGWECETPIPNFKHPAVTTESELDYLSKHVLSTPSVGGIGSKSKSRSNKTYVIRTVTEPMASKYSSTLIKMGNKTYSNKFATIFGAANIAHDFSVLTASEFVTRYGLYDDE